MNRIRILLADDHALVRAGLRYLINRMDGLEVVAEAENGHRVLELVPQEHPDVILMDITMPVMNGLDATAEVKARFPHLRVLILSMSNFEAHVAGALEAGADGYLLKTISPAELEKAIRVVMGGETYLDPEVAQLVVSCLRHSSEARPSLTNRQRQILQMVAEGFSTKAIAGKLGLSPKTVEAHRAALMTTLDIDNIAGLVRYAVRTGMVEV